MVIVTIMVTIPNVDVWDISQDFIQLTSTKDGFRAGKINRFIVYFKYIVTIIIEPIEIIGY